jgi:hypothetical protein
MMTSILFGIVCRISVCTPDARRWTLAMYSAPSAWDAVRWLRERAVILADGIDPDPTAPWYPSGAVVPAAEELQGDDTATRLRLWSNDPFTYEAAMAALEHGSTDVVMRFGEPTALTYVLSAGRPSAVHLRQPGCAQRALYESARPL